VFITVYQSVDYFTRLVFGLLFPLQEWIFKYVVRHVTLQITAEPQIGVITTLWITQSVTLFFISKIIPLAESIEILLLLILARLVPVFGVHFVKSTEYYYQKYGLKKMRLSNQVVGSGTVTARAQWRAYLLSIGVAFAFDCLNECLALFIFLPWYGWRTYVLSIESDPNHIQLNATLVYVGLVAVVSIATSLWLSYCFKKLLPPYLLLAAVIVKSNLLLCVLHVSLAMAIGFLGV
jgi:hypothetical protein